MYAIFSKPSVFYDNIIAFVENFKGIGIQIAVLRSVRKIRAQIIDCAFVEFGCFVRFRF